MNSTHRLGALQGATDLALLSVACALAIPEELVVTLALNCYLQANEHLKTASRFSLGMKWHDFQSEINEATLRILSVRAKAETSRSGLRHLPILPTSLPVLGV